MEISLAAEPILTIGAFKVTNALLMSWLVMIVLTVIAITATRKVTMRPGKLQNFFEFIIESLYDLCHATAGARARTFFPYVATFFLFILLSNWIGLVPGLGAIGWHKIQHGHETFVPLFRPVAADLNSTLALALISVVLTQYFGWRFRGWYGYVKHYFHNPLQGGIGLIVLGLIIGLFVGMLELISELVKVVSLSFRLFGNIYAGEVVIHTISGLFSYIAPVPFLLLETVVGLVQATVFALLSLVFFSIISQPTIDQEH